MTKTANPNNLGLLSLRALRESFLRANLLTDAFWLESSPMRRVFSEQLKFEVRHLEFEIFLPNDKHVGIKILVSA